MNRYLLAAAAAVCVFAPTLRAEWKALTFEVIDAQFSTALNRVVMISKNPHQLHIFNPANNVDQVVNLPAWPFSLSVGPDGMFAAVGHPSSISYISLANASIAKLLPISYEAWTVVLAGNDYIYTVPDLWVRISTGAQGLGSLGGPEQHFARMHPNGKVIYSEIGDSIRKIDISTGVPRMGLYVTTPQLCNRFTLLPGNRLITECSRVYEVDPNPDTMTGRIVSPLTPPGGAGAYGTVAYREGAPIATASVTRVAFHDSDSFALLGETTFDTTPRGDIEWPRIFYNADASRLTVLGSPLSGQNFNPWYIRTYNISGRSPACSPTMTASGTTLPPSGGSLSVTVNAPADCLWRVTRSDAALQVENGGYGIGSKTRTVVAPASGKGIAQQFRIATGATTIDLSQGPNTQPLLLGGFPGVIGDSKYDRTRDRIVLASAAPNLLQIWDTTQGGIVAALDLPFPPVSLSLSSDGAHAAVGYGAAVSYIDLNTRKILWTRSMDRTATRVFLIGERIYAFLDQYSLPRTFVTSTAEELDSPFAIFVYWALLHPGGRYIYGFSSGEVMKLDTQAGTLQVVYRAPGVVCPFEFDEKGENVVGCTGSVYRVGASETNALSLRGIFPGVSGLNSITHSSQLGAYAASLTQHAASQELTFFSARSLRSAGNIPLAPVTLPDTGSVPDIFFNPGGSRMYAILQVNGLSSTLPRRVFVETVPIQGVTDSCPVSLGPPPPPLSPVAAVANVSVDTAYNCLWRVSATEPWIDLASDVGIGAGTVTFGLARNYTTASRTAKVVVNGKEVLVTQGPGIAVTGVLPQSVEPSSGLIHSEAFFVRFTNASAMTVAYISFGSAPASPASCTLEYNHSNSQFRILDDQALSWTPAEYGFMANSQCSIFKPAVHVSGSTVVLTLPVTFAPPLYGTRDVYVIANDASGTSGWRKRGTYTIGGENAGTGPGIGIMLPEAGAGASQRFTGVFTHDGGQGMHYLGYLLFLRTPNIVSYTAKSSCLVEYNALSHGMRLINDAGDDWLGPLIGIRVGSPGATLKNAQCTLDIGSAVATQVGNAMTVEAPITFHSASPVTMTFMQGFDVRGRYTGMTQIGTWVTGLPTTRAPGPAIDAVSKASTGNTHTVTVAASHTGGASELVSIHLRFGASIVAPEFCHIYYLPGENAVNLISDAGVPAGANLKLGGGGTLSNSRCSVSASGARAVSGNSMTVTLPVTFHTPAAFEGDRNMYVNAFDRFGNLTHWVSGGSLRVQ